MPEKKILLVDDEPSIRFVVGAVLEQAGYAVETAEDGYAALRIVQRSAPDLVITDLRMPNMNGFELLSVIRSRYPNLPTIVLSGEFVSCDSQEGTLADAFFQKGSYAIPDLQAKIEHLLASPSARVASHRAPVWSPVGDAPVMLTCTACLRSFPIDPCEQWPASKTMTCLFCGEHLTIELAAIGVAR